LGTWCGRGLKKGTKNVSSAQFVFSNFIYLQFNARNIKGESSGQNTKMEYTLPITALSEMTEKIVSITKYHHQQPLQTADLVSMATCYFSWAINMFFLHGFAGSKSTLKS
jgi:hypothetical protein